MKKLVFLLLLVGLSIPAQAALTYGQTFYNLNRQYAGQGGPNDPVKLFIGEVDTALDALDPESFAPTVIEDLESITFAAAASTITLTADGAADDLTIAVAGAQNSSLILSSAGTGDDAIGILTTAGGINIVMTGGAAGEDFEITTATSIDFSSSEAAADQFKVDATGTIAGNAINFETTDGGILLNADGANNGDITLDAADDLVLTVAGNVVGNIQGDGSDTLIGYLRGIEIEPATSEQLLVSDSGKVFVNTAGQGATTFTLPDAAAGLTYTFVDFSATGADDVIIQPQAGDSIDGDTAGDAVRNTADEASASVTIVAIDTTNWITISSVGTWTQD